MYICYFKDLVNDREFCKKFSSPYLMNQFLTKCRYSKKIRFLGSSKQWV